MDSSTNENRGFSLIELLIAMAITAGMAAVVFNLFLQNQSLFRDQNLTIELQQSVRAIASMMADELRMAGQGVPTYAASMDSSNVESVQTFLNGTGGDSILFRAGIRNGTGAVTNTPPLTYAEGTPAALFVEDITSIFLIAGGEIEDDPSNPGLYVYIWGQTGTSWTWARALINVLDQPNNAMIVTAAETASGGDQFPFTPMIWVEEAIGYQLSGTNLQRGTAGDFTTQTDPAMSWTTVGENFTGLTFTYYDDSGNVVTVADDDMDTIGDIEDRADIRRVDFTIAARTAVELPSTGDFGTFEITMTVYPRNVQMY